MASAAPDGTLGTALMSAVVTSTGTLNRGGGVVSATRSDTGVYHVLFDRSVTDCTYNAMTGGVAPGTTYLALANAGPLSGIPNGVRVRTTLSTNNVSVNADFYLLVFCHK